MQSGKAVTGMVAVAGRTYRIVRIGSGLYAVFRILDDLRVGTFRSRPTLDIWPENIDAPSLMAVARQAIHSAKTSWVGSVRADGAAPASVSVTERVGRRTSSNPPPNAAPA